MSIEGLVIRKNRDRGATLRIVSRVMRCFQAKKGTLLMYQK